MIFLPFKPICAFLSSFSHFSMSDFRSFDDNERYKDSKGFFARSVSWDVLGPILDRRCVGYGLPRPKNLSKEVTP